MNVRLNIPEGTTIVDGKQISFRAPCAGSSIENLVIGSTSYALTDTRGYPVYQSSAGYFVSGALVHVILDTVNSRAYLQSPAGPLIQIVRW